MRPNRTPGQNPMFSLNFRGLALHDSEVLRPRVYSFAHCISMFVLLRTVWAVSAWPRPEKTPLQARETIVAIADVHNDFDDFVAILRHTGLMDQQNHWTGGKTTCVQAGGLVVR